MKTSIYLIALFCISVTYCAEQLPDHLVPIFNHIKNAIHISVLPSPKEELETFLRGEEAISLEEKLKDFSLDDKNRLMRKVHNIEGGNLLRYRRTQFLAAIVKAGGDIDAHLNLETFLGDCVLHEDIKGVIFALKHNANPCLKFCESSILSLAKTHEMASRLMKHRHYRGIPEKPLKLSSFLKENTQEQYDVLAKSVDYDYPPEILKLYHEKGFDLKLRDEYNWSLLHRLCSTAEMCTPDEFIEKFLTLLHADAVDLNLNGIVDKSGTPLDILNKSSSDNPTVQLAKTLLKNLSENPAEMWQSLFHLAETTEAAEEEPSDTTSKKRSHAEAFEAKV